MTEWSDDIYQVLCDTGVKQVAYVPDAGHAKLIERCNATPGMTALSLSTEEEGVALLAGAWLGGQRGVLLMQSSGVGNCVNMLSLAKTCEFPLLMLVTMRGEAGEFNEWQVPMGQATQGHLELCGVQVRRAETAETVGDTVRAAADLAFDGDQAAAVLIAQQVIGVKSFQEE